MGKLKSDDKSKPAPKNRVSVLFIFSVAVILAIIGVSSWSFFGKQAQRTAPVSTASTSIDPPVEISSPPTNDIQEMEAAPEATPTRTPEVSAKETEEETVTTPESPPVAEFSEKPEPTVSENVIQEAMDREQEILPAPADQAPLPPESLAVETESNDTKPEAAPLPTDAHSDGTETAAELAPIITDTPVTTSDAQEENPTSDNEAPQQATAPPSELTAKEPTVVEDEASDTILDAPLDANEVETSKNVSAPSLPIEPDLEEETTKTEEKIQENVTELTEADSQTDIGIETDAKQPVAETAEAEPDAEPEAETTDEENTTVEPLDPASEETIAEDPRLPWQKHAAIFDDKDNRPRIAIVISEAGISSSRTKQAINELPSAVTLGFDPYGNNLQQLVDLARKSGHEVILQLPMEPLGYPRIDPGPQAMRTDLNVAENLDRLDWALNRFSGYAGVTNQMGSRFTSDANSILPVLEVVKENGIYFLDSRTASNSKAADIAQGLNIPVAINNRFLDHKSVGEEFAARLAELESISRKNGSAIGIAYPYGETFRRLSDWAKSLDQKGIVLAPVSAIIKGKKES